MSLDAYGLKDPVKGDKKGKKRFEIVKTTAYLLRDNQDRMNYDLIVDFAQNGEAHEEAKLLKKELEQKYGELIEYDR